MILSETVAALRHDLLSAAAGEIESFTVPQSDEGIGDFGQAATDLVALLIRWLAEQCGDDTQGIANEVRAALRERDVDEALLSTEADWTAAVSAWSRRHRPTR